MKKIQSKNFPKEKLGWVAALGVVAGIVAAAFLLPGGDDLYRYYQPFEQGCLHCGYVPFFAQWFLWPLLFFNYPFAWPFWTILCGVGFLLVAKYAKINPFLFLISFPMLGQVWLGQIDMFICAGLLILLLSRNPFLRGLGITLALIKPQLTGLAIVTMLLLENRRAILKTLAIPLAVIAISLIIYGISWPLDWLQNAMTSLPLHVWRLASIKIWLFGLILLPVPFLFQDRKKRLQVSLLVSAIATPFFGVYSYIIFLMFDLRWWAVLLSFAWVLAYPLYRENAMQFAWVLPLTMIFSLTWQELRSRRQSRKG